MRRIDEILHPGELKAQEIFNDRRVWNESSLASLNRMFRETIDDELAYFIEGQKYFFISTSNKQGECDCSFRGTESDADGELLQAVKVIDARTIVFPDYAGNRLYNSLGNILENPNIGMLFIGFRNATRLRVNGSATIIRESEEFNALWPKALSYVKVGVKQAYFNCQKRIRQSVGF